MSRFTNEDTFFRSCLEVVDIMDCYKSTCMASKISGVYRRVGCSGLRITPAQPTEAGGGKLFGAVSFAFVALCRYWWDRLYFCSMLEPYVFDGHRMRLFWKQGCVPGARRRGALICRLSMLSIGVNESLAILWYDEPPEGTWPIRYELSSQGFCAEGRTEE